MGRLKWINLRYMLLRHISISPYYLLSHLRTQICPDLHPYPVGVEKDNAVGIYSLLSNQLKCDFMRMLKYSENSLGLLDRNCCLKVPGGLDCAGDQKEYQQRSQLGLDTTHLENGSYVIVSIHAEPESLPLMTMIMVLERMIF